MADFQKRHYVAIAAVLRNRLQAEKEAATSLSYGRPTSAGVDALDKVISDLVDLFIGDNARFANSHFLSVVEGEKPLNSRP